MEKNSFSSTNEMMHKINECFFLPSFPDCLGWNRPIIEHIENITIMGKFLLIEASVSNFIKNSFQHLFAKFKFDFLSI